MACNLCTRNIFRIHVANLLRDLLKLDSFYWVCKNGVLPPRVLPAQPAAAWPGPAAAPPAHNDWMPTVKPVCSLFTRFDAAKAYLV
jgi:hypothetical protein